MKLKYLPAAIIGIIILAIILTFAFAGVILALILGAILFVLFWILSLFYRGKKRREGPKVLVRFS